MTIMYVRFPPPTKNPKMLQKRIPAKSAAWGAEMWIVVPLLLFVCAVPFFTVMQQSADGPVPNGLQAALAAPTPKKNGPLFVLHVGPAKTATTSLQYMLNQYEPLLLEDNYVYVGANSTSLSNPFDGRCLRRLKKGDSSCWKIFMSELETHRKQGHNIVLSNEVISLQANTNEIVWDLLKAAIQPWMPNVRVIVGYRHLHNFVPSTHYELQRNQRWPSVKEHGKPVTPFTKFYEDLFNKEELISGPIPSSAATIRKFSEHYNVSVLDIESTEQVSEFVCRLLPNAKRACKQHQEQPPTMPSLNQNDAGQVNYDSLAIVAFNNLVLKKEQTRKYVRAKVKYFNEVRLGNGPNDFPLDCLSPDQEKELLNLSIRHAKESRLPTIDEEAIRKSFEKAKAKKKFCSINATLAYEIPEWKEYFGLAKTAW